MDIMIANQFGLFLIIRGTAAWNFGNLSILYFGSTLYILLRSNEFEKRFLAPHFLKNTFLVTVLVCQWKSYLGRRWVLWPKNYFDSDNIQTHKNVHVKIHFLIPLRRLRVAYVRAYYSRLCLFFTISTHKRIQTHNTILPFSKFYW